MAARRARKARSTRDIYADNEAVRERIPSRMQKLVKDFGGTSAFAYYFGLNPKYVYRWTTNGMVPSTDTLIQMAVKGNVNPDWVLFGRGDRYINGRTPTAVQNAAA